jgi:hypothetical protein
MAPWTNVKDLENLKRAETILHAKLNGEADMGLPAKSKWDASKPPLVKIIKSKTLSIGDSERDSLNAVRSSSSLIRSVDTAAMNQAAALMRLLDFQAGIEPIGSLKRQLQLLQHQLRPDQLLQPNLRSLVDSVQCAIKQTVVMVGALLTAHVTNSCQKKMKRIH